MARTPEQRQLKQAIRGEKWAARIYGFLTVASWLNVLGTIGAEGLFDVVTAGAGLAALPAEAGIDLAEFAETFWVTNEWHKHHKRLKALRRGQNPDAIVHTPILTHNRPRRTQAA